MPKFFQSSAPKGGAHVRNKADSILIRPARLNVQSIFRMPKFLQSSAPKGGARVRNKADSIFGYILPEQDCMNYLSVCPA
jgi:hypothetical protein